MAVTEAGRASYVVGTAGHVDHGKSALVRALTGTDPDRLEEEKRRGMTIDLGFAALDLPGGNHVAFVDVPGHHRFLKNMLAGVHGFDAVLFVVAADEGPMPQTREHLAIIELLGIAHGVVALTKIDLVDEEWRGLVTAEVRESLMGSRLREAAIVPVSSLTGAGLVDLRAELERLLAAVPPRIDIGRPRLAVDRSFAMAGFGTVVTGTLVDGQLGVAAELLILPGGQRARVRGLQQHGRSVDLALPGSRTAVNLSGVERRELGRGDVLAVPGSLATARRIDARLSVLQDASRPLRHRDRLLLYHGTAELPVEVVLLGGDELPPGRSGLAQLHLQEPLAAVALDRFILRIPSPAATVAGGVILDMNPRRHRRRDRAVMAELEARDGQAPRQRLEAELARNANGMTAHDIALRLGLSVEEAQTLIGQLVESKAAVGLADRFLSLAAWDRIQSRMLSVLSSFHASAPLRQGMPREELRSRGGIPAAVFAAAVARMAAERLLQLVPGGLLALPAHRPRLSENDGRRVEEALEELRASGLSPPPLSDWMRRHGLNAELFTYLVQEGRVIRVGPETAFARPVYDQAVERLRAHLHDHQAVSVAQARDLLGSSRRYVLPLLEWLDAQKVTRRVGDDRILRG